MQADDSRSADSPAWVNIEAATGWTIPPSVRQACIGPKLVTIPAGLELFAGGPAEKNRMEWGAFAENDIGWYLHGNQLEAGWYLGNRTERVPFYEYTIVLDEPTVAIMSKVATQPGASTRAEPAKFQYYSPVGFGKPLRLRLLGHLEVDGTFRPAAD